MMLTLTEISPKGVDFIRNKKLKEKNLTPKYVDFQEGRLYPEFLKRVYI